jgi:hypothetical protein
MIGVLVRDYGDPFGEAVACRAEVAVSEFSFPRAAWQDDAIRS